MAVTWEEASQEVIDLAEELIEAHHPELKQAKIGIIFRSEAQKGTFKTTLARAWKVTDKLRVYLDFDFMIWIAEDEWKYMEETIRRAVVDHELTHCWRSPLKGWTIIPHDLEEFTTIIERYGLWNSYLYNAMKRLLKAVQNELPTIELSDHRGRVATVTSEQLAGLANGRIPLAPKGENNE